MFSASRYYGWPSSFILVNKTTESFDEAKKVKTENLPGLIKDGWQIHFRSNNMGVYGSILNLATNYLLCLIFAFLIVNTTHRFCRNRA